MVAVKVQIPAAAKTAAANRTAQTKTSAQSDDFTKLLQMKKDSAEQPKKAEQSQGNSNKVDNSGKDDAQDTSKVKGEEPKQETEEVSSSDKENMEQAALQQMAAQLLLQAGVAEEAVQETTAETNVPQVAVVEEVQEEAVFLTQEVSEEQPKTAGNDTKPELKAEIKAEVKTETTQDVTNVVQEKAPQAVQEQKSNSGNGDLAQSDNQPKTEFVDDRKTRQPSEEVTVGQETVYSAEVSKPLYGEEVSPVVQKTEGIPLKTTPENLPEDLGKTLAARTLEMNRTLTVELEPASLGKLTIKLVYEGERAALSIMATNPKTLELLNQKASEIAAILEEKTGQETVIYTHQAEQNSEEYEEQKQNSHSGQSDQGEGQQNHQQEKHQSESFAQQLRLGLV